MYVLSSDNVFKQIWDNVFLAACISFTTWISVSVERVYYLPILLMAILIARNYWQSAFFDVSIQGHEFVLNNIYSKKRRIPVNQFSHIEEGFAMRTRSGADRYTLKLCLLDGRKYKFAITREHAADVEKRIREYLMTINYTSTDL